MSDIETIGGCRAAFEMWVKDRNDAEIKWIGHSYANAYMAAQWDGWQAAYNTGKAIYEQDVQPYLLAEDWIGTAALAIWKYNGGLESVFDAVNKDGFSHGNIQKLKCIEQATAVYAAIRQAMEQTK